MTKRNDRRLARARSHVTNLAHAHLARALLMFVCTSLLLSGEAHAQPVTADAEQLFREGKRLMAEGNIAAACEAFAGSQRREPTISTLLNLADCREKNQQYASAWGHFIDAARQARRDPSAGALRDVAERRAHGLESRLSFLIISVPDEAQVDGLIITRNGETVESDLWNRDLPVDGGTYVIAGKAPGYEAWSTTVSAANAKDKQSVNVPRFRAVPVAPPATQARIPVRRRSTAAMSLWTTGGLALAGGVAAEFWAQSTYEDAKLSMDNDRRRELTGSATNRRRLGVALDVAAFVAVGVGTYLWLTPVPGRRVNVAPQVTAADTSIVVMGSF